MESVRHRDENLLVVAAVQGYSERHSISGRQAFELLRSNGVLKMVRDNYATLHTQGMWESADFAEDVMRLRRSRPVPEPGGEEPAVTVVYKGRDLSSLVALKTELIAAELAERLGTDFDTALGRFLDSRTYEVLMSPGTLMWGENAAFVVDEYLRERPLPG